MIMVETKDKNPKDFKNQGYIVAYGIEGLSDHVDLEFMMHMKLLRLIKQR